MGGGLAVDDYAGEVRVDGVGGGGGPAGVGDLLTGVFEASDGEVGEDAYDLLGWRPGRGGPAVEDAVGQGDALVAASSLLTGSVPYRVQADVTD